MMPTSRIPFDTNNPDIILISYPPGGFGNFIYYLLSEFADETVKQDNSSFSFSGAGNAHAVKKYTVTYGQQHKQYIAKIDSNVDSNGRKILVLVDRAFIDNDYTELYCTFPNAKIVRMTLNPKIYNIVAAMIASKTVNVPVDLRYRENYSGIGMFRPIDHKRVVNVSIQNFILDPFETFYQLTQDLGLTVIKTEQLHEVVADWRRVHKPYFEDLYKEFHKEHLL